MQSRKTVLEIEVEWRILTEHEVDGIRAKLDIASEVVYD
jgi:hypothetical protein